MPETIRDGKGRGFLATVNSDNQLVTRATSVEQRLHSAVDELYYEATTGQIILTNDTETGIIYIKNETTDGKILVIDRLFYDFWTSTGGSGGDGTLRYYKSPTITGGTEIIPTNTNFKSTNSAFGTFYKSLTTITGTVWWTAYITDKTSIALEERRIVLPSSSSFGVSVAAPTGNTNMKISINIAFYYFDGNLIQ